jgi:beta-mannan synthase
MEEGLGLWGWALATAGASWDRVAAAWAAAVWARAVAPSLEAAVWLCLTTSVMLVLEVCYMSIVSFVTVLLRRVPERRYRWEPMPVLPGSGKDEEAAAGGGEARWCSCRSPCTMRGR